MRYRKIIRAFVVLSFILLSLRPVLACQCDPLPICEAYSRARKVFIGKLEKVVEDKTAPFYTIQAHFAVSKTFKGITNSVEVVTFKLGDCNWLNFNAGEEYFVYAEEFNINTYCNRTVLLSEANQDLKYASALSESTPIFYITGQIYPDEKISTSNLKKIKLFVKAKGENRRVDIDKKGVFNFAVKDKGNYEVKLLLPFEADISFMQDREPPLFKISSSDSLTKVSYDLQFKPNECDFRVISIVKKD